MSAITSRLAPSSPVPWRVLSVAAVLLLAFLVGLALVASGAFRKAAPPFGPAANGQLFYSANGDLFRRDAGGQPVALVTGEDRDSFPVVSPDGSKVSFIRSTPSKAKQIWAMDADGGNLHQLAAPEGEPGWFEWSPQGDVAAYLSDGNGLGDQLFIVPADGSAATSFDTGIDLEQAWWRPSAGSQLALLGTEPDGTRGIWLINRDGTGLQRLDLDPGFQSDPFYKGAEQYYFWTMTWSPRGDRLLYSQLEPVATAPDHNGFRVHLASIAGDGTVTDDRLLEVAPQSDDEFAPAWLPNGDGMVIQSVEGYRYWLSSATISNGTVGLPRDLRINATDFIGVQVAPDGRSLLAIMPAANGGTPQVRLLDLETLDATPVDIGDDVSWQRRAP
jgi:dipeptidyl aminopeptidase/acylaminoacyl peptidase